MRVYKELAIDSDIPWGEQKVETQEKAKQALKQAIINSLVIDQSVGERLQKLSDWRFYSIGQQEKKRIRKERNEGQENAIVTSKEILGMLIICSADEFLLVISSERSRRRQRL